MALYEITGTTALRMVALGMKKPEDAKPAQTKEGAVKPGPVGIPTYSAPCVLRTFPEGTDKSVYVSVHNYAYYEDFTELQPSGRVWIQIWDGGYKFIADALVPAEPIRSRKND